MPTLVAYLAAYDEAMKLWPVWALNIADFSKDYRVYAIDLMGQPSKSIPDEPVRNAANYVARLTAALDGLHPDRISLLGRSVAPISGC